jgi:hypothetical protein
MVADHRLYLWRIVALGVLMSETGLQKLAYILLVALTLYVSVTGGA